MGKKKKKFSSFDGKATGYDYLRDKFNKNYEPHRSDRMSGEIYNRERDEAFQRYLMTGDKYSGMDPGMRRYREKLDKKLDKKPSVEDRLFEAGIPPSQWQYYANKAGITNVNSKGDAEKLIDVYNKDERYQGPENPLDEAALPAPEAFEPLAPPKFNISVEEDNRMAEERDQRIADYEANRAFTGLIGEEDTSEYLDQYKFNVSEGLKKAGVATRGPNAPQFIL